MRLLVVDDEMGIHHAIERELIDFELDLEFELDALVAKEKLTKNNYDILLVDYQMPHMNGLELLKYAKSLSPDLVTILMTGYAEFDILIDAINEGNVYRFIAKPWESAKLKKNIEEAIGYRSKLQEKNYILSQYFTDKQHWMNISEALKGRISEQKTGLLSAFLRIMQVKDYSLYKHSKNVSILASEFGQFIGKSSHEVEVLNQAGLLHDIGKLVIKDRIVFKKGRLDEDEYTEMRRHPMIGAEILKEIPSFAHLANIVAQHHEREDGGGYPYGLKSADIKEEATIIGLADVLDALVSQRVYKISLPIEAAFEIISSGSAGYFHQATVDQFAQYVKGTNQKIFKSNVN